MVLGSRRGSPLTDAMRQQALQTDGRAGRQLDTLRGELLNFRARTADGWGTGTVRVNGSAPAYAREAEVTGKLVGCRAGDTVELEGRWHEHPKYGRQFKVQRALASEPDSDEGRVAWMCSRLPGLGAVRARALVQRFGDDLWRVIEQEPQRLAEINGITAKRAQQIAEAYASFAAERDCMVKLRGWGLTDNQVARCKDKWGSLPEVIAKLSADPYELCTSVYGFGFLRADVVARKMGVPLDAPARIRAGLEYVLDSARQQGHCYMAGRALQVEGAKLLGLDEGAVGKQIVLSAELGRVVKRGWRVYSRTVDRAERVVAERLREMMRGGE